MGLGWLWWRAWSLVMPGHFAWQAWRLVTSTFVLRGRRAAYKTGLALVARLVPREAAPLCVAGVALGSPQLPKGLKPCA